jgi:AcrR family transcriptional regulator
LSSQGKVSFMEAVRVRRTPQQARQQILDAAAALLAEGGLAAVQVRAVANRVGMTDAGVSHHFGNRDTLLRELLRHGGRQLRRAVDERLRSWLGDGTELFELVRSLANLYDQGYAELAVALHAAGWRDKRSGMLDPLVEALHQRRPDRETADLDDTRLAVAALHQALATEPLYGPAFRRSAGLTGTRATNPNRQLHWWATQLALALGLEPPPTRHHIHS